MLLISLNFSLLKFEKQSNNMNTKLRVSIGISAYNEEKNIAFLLRELLKQSQHDWSLKEIIVCSDGSTDKTVHQSKLVRSSFIKILEDRTQKGKVKRVEQMFQSFEGDVLVLLDADLKLENNVVIENLIKPFHSSSEIVLTAGNTRPFKPTTFFERAVYSTFMVFDESRKFKNNGNNIFGCNGGCLAIDKTFARSLRFPNIINEDDYIYFSCVKAGLNFKHVPNAIVYYKLPNNLRDYLKQSFRSNPDAVIQNFSHYFGDLVAQEYSRPIVPYIVAILKSFFRYPLETIYISVIALLSKPFYPIISKRFKLSWYTAASTK